MPISSIGNMPTRKTGNSGMSRKVSDRLRIGSTNRNDNGWPQIRSDGGGRSSRKGVNAGRAVSARRHPSADLGAQLVDQLQALLGLDMPEGPAVASFGTLR